LEIHTRSMLCITELYSLFYINKTKIIKFSVYNELTYIALANWIIGDGTDSYSIKYVVMLINILIIKYDIHCTIRYYSFPVIYVYKRYMPKLRSIVEPFMHISMMYKLGKKKKRIDWVV
jgi:hypothetical protein